MNHLNNFFEELAEKNRILANLLRSGMNERDARIIVYGLHAVETVDRITEIHNPEPDGMQLLNSSTKLPFEPSQNK